MVLDNNIITRMGFPMVQFGIYLIAFVHKWWWLNSVLPKTRRIRTGNMDVSLSSSASKPELFQLVTAPRRSSPFKGISDSYKFGILLI